MSELDKDAVDAVKTLAREAKGIVKDSVSVPNMDLSIPLAVRYTKDGYVPIDLKAEADKWRDAPEYRKGVATANTMTSFVDLVNRHKDAGSAIFANLVFDAPSLTAVINYHDLDLAPRWGNHRIGYAFPLSDEWKAWVDQDGKVMDQVGFASWVEDHAHELSSPTDDEKKVFEELLQTTIATPAQIVSLSRSMALYADIKVAEARVLSSGETQLTFEEKHKDSDGKPLKVPGLIMLSVPLFFGGATARVPVRLRYRRAGGSLAWVFSLWRAKEIMRTELVTQAADAAAAVDLPMYEGSPEK